MTPRSSAAQSARIHVEHVGGIDVSTTSLEPGVNVVVGRNGTNRTSFLQAIMAVLGSNLIPLKANADRGRVELELDGETYLRTLRRHNGDVVIDGTPYCDDPELPSLFAFLLRSNESRRAITPEANLRELIVRPVDTETIQSEITTLEEEQHDVGEELARLDTLSSELPGLKEERKALQDRIAEKNEALKRAKREIDAIEIETEAENVRTQLEERLTDLHDKHASLEEVRYQMGNARQRIGALREEREEVESRLEELVPNDADTLEDAIEQRRDQEGSLETVVNELETVISFNTSVVDGEPIDGVEAVRTRGNGTDDRDPDETTCWTCGNDTSRDEMKESLSGLRELRREKLSERRDNLIELTDLEERRAERDTLRDRLEAIEEERVEREEKLTDLREWRRALNGDVKNVRHDIDDLPVRNLGDLVDRHKEASEIEFEIERLQDDLAHVEERITEIERQLDERDALEARRDELCKNLTKLRNRIEHIETEAVELFNEHVAAVLDRLEYNNLERVWLERVVSGDDSSTFTLHIVRSTGDVLTHEDTIGHLSESEREVIGVIFALTGYLVHDAHEKTPFLLLDSVEAIDSDRIASLVEYLAEYAGYLVVALQPDDAAALDADYHRVTDI